MPFSQIFPPSPSPTESIILFYTSVSLLLSHTQGYCYHLSKFHIYALVYNHFLKACAWLSNMLDQRLSMKMSLREQGSQHADLGEC